MKQNRLSGTAMRYVLFLAGLFVISLGVAFSTKAGLGTSPVASPPYSVSLVSSLLSFGSWLILFNILQILVQIAVTKGRCNYFEIAVQTVTAFVYGYLTDFSCRLINGISVTGYPAQLACMLLSCFILALGIWIQLKAGVAMLPCEAMNRAISRATGKRYETVKILVDVFYIIIAAVICMVFLGELKGVREGSIVTALSVGSIIRLLNHAFDRITGAFSRSRKQKSPA